MSGHAVAQDNKVAQPTTQAKKHQTTADLEQVKNHHISKLKKEVESIHAGEPLPAGYEEKKNLGFINNNLTKDEKLAVSQVRDGKLSIEGLVKINRHDLVEAIARDDMGRRGQTDARAQMAKDIIASLPKEELDMLADGKMIPKTIRDQNFHGHERRREDEKAAGSDPVDSSDRTNGKRPTDNKWDQTLVQQAKAEQISRIRRIETATNNTRETLTTIENRLATLTSPSSAHTAHPVTTPATKPQAKPDPAPAPKPKPSWRQTNIKESEAMDKLANGTHTLRRGMQGEDIEVLADGLQRVTGVDQGNPAEWDKYGPKVTAGVKKLQEMINKEREAKGEKPIATDGIFGNQTRADAKRFFPELFNEKEVAADPTPDPTPEPDAVLDQEVATSQEKIEATKSYFEDKINDIHISKKEMAELNERIAALSPEELQEMKKSYAMEHGKTMQQSVATRDSIIAGDYDELRHRLDGNNDLADATALNEALNQSIWDGEFNDDFGRVEQILESRTPEQLEEINKIYNELDKAIIGKGEDLYDKMEGDLNKEQFARVKEILKEKGVASFEKYLGEEAETAAPAAEPETEPEAEQTTQVDQELDAETTQQIETIKGIIDTNNIDGVKALTETFKTNSAEDLKAFAEAYKSHTGEDLLESVRKLSRKHPPRTRHYGTYQSMVRALQDKLK